MKKRNLCALALAASLSASLLAGCAGNKGNADTTAATTATEAATTTAGAEAGAENTSGAGESADSSQSETSENSGSSRPDSGGSSGNGQTGSENSGAGEVSVDKALADILGQIKDTYGDNYRPQAEMDAQMLEDMMGVGPDLYDSYVAEMPLISNFVETFVGIQAKEDAADEVLDALETYREQLVGNTMQYPMNLPVIESSQVIRHDNYIFFVMLGTPGDAELEKGEAAALESAEKNNQIAIDIIDGYFE